MLKIILNQNEIVLPKKMSLDEILRLYSQFHSNYSVAINHQFIPRETYVLVFPNNGDVIDIISPMQGG